MTLIDGDSGAKACMFGNDVGEAFTIQIANERIRVPECADFNIEHEREDGEEEIEFQLKWTHDTDEDDAAPDTDPSSDV